MSEFENPKRFFHAVDNAESWDECSRYVADSASFSAQSEPLTDIRTVKGYVDWMAEFGTKTVPGCSYELHAASYDEENRAATFFATFTATHSGEGGPVAPIE